MELLISHHDVTGLDIYAVLFDRNSGMVLNYTLSQMETFSPASISDYAIPLTEDANRKGYYSASLVSGDLVPIGMAYVNFTVEIKEKVGGSYNYDNDFLKSAQSTFWTGNFESSYIKEFALEIPEYLGSYTYNQNVNYITILRDRVNNPVRASGDISYTVFNNNSVVTNTGVASFINTTQNLGFYNINFKASGSNYSGDGVYRIRVSGQVESKKYVGESYFNFAVSGLPVNIIDQLGFVSAAVNDAGANTTDFITTLPSTNNDHYNGQIIRFTSGPLVGQGRIISDYNGITKRLYVNKAFVSAPGNGATFVIFPIGGELGVS